VVSVKLQLYQFQPLTSGTADKQRLKLEMQGTEVMNLWQTTLRVPNQELERGRMRAWWWVCWRL